MNKEEFLSELLGALSGIPQSDAEERVSFYSEMIDDRVEEGLTEEEAVAGLGSVENIISQIAADTPIVKLVKEKIKPKRRMRGWEIALIILGFPVWFPLLVAFCAIVFSLYVVVWALIVSLGGRDLTLGGRSLRARGVRRLLLLRVRSARSRGARRRSVHRRSFGLHVFRMRRGVARDRPYDRKDRN